MDKTQLRRDAAQRRDALPDRAAKSLAICHQIIASAVYQNARAIHSYLPMRSEVDVRPLIEHALAHGKAVGVPVVERGAAELRHVWLDSLDETTLSSGVFGTAHPRSQRHAAPGEWQLVIVPLLAFDRHGQRLGYGKGYYDRLLAALPVATIGVAFAAQEVATLPAEPHDIPLDWIATENELLRTSGA